MVCFAYLQFAMVTERFVALWKRSKYESFGKKVGMGLATISVGIYSIFFAFAATAWTLRREEYSTTAYCSSSTPNSLTRLSVLCIVLCGVSVATSAGIAILYSSNHVAVKSKPFDLTTSYQLNENYSVIKLLLPLTVFQNICYVYFTASSAVFTLLANRFEHTTFRILFPLCYVIPFYTFVCPILIWYIVLKSRRLNRKKLEQATQVHNKADDVYFDAYSKVWG
ncbi:unnamed protein product [Cylicostephanus goldi]|uniref:G-protein coupled receptors family 1 profile domain-containing protein n=1 Tax=Cylicostephanus goldi TaxID=71465 RepID=A0A3P6SGJ5_CYLGO|nr:unnamed protein product [Cylicostephanus goldi]